MTEQVKQYIGGEFAISDSKQWLDVTNAVTKYTTGYFYLSGIKERAITRQQDK